MSLRRFWKPVLVTSATGASVLLVGWSYRSYLQQTSIERYDEFLKQRFVWDQQFRETKRAYQNDKVKLKEVSGDLQRLQMEKESLERRMASVAENYNMTIGKLLGHEHTANELNRNVQRAATAYPYWQQHQRILRTDQIKSTFKARQLKLQEELEQQLQTIEDQIPANVASTTTAYQFAQSESS